MKSRKLVSSALSVSVMGSAVSSDDYKDDLDAQLDVKQAKQHKIETLVSYTQAVFARKMQEVTSHHSSMELRLIAEVPLVKQASLLLKDAGWSKPFSPMKCKPLSKRKINQEHIQNVARRDLSELESLVGPQSTLLAQRMKVCNVHFINTLCTLCCALFRTAGSSTSPSSTCCPCPR